MRRAFFTGTREDFFRPLAGPWREVVVQTVIAMYDSILGGGRRGAHFVDRNDLKDMAVTALQDFPVLDGDSEDADPVLYNMRDEASKANEIIRRLRTYGWIERFDDPGTQREVYRFTRMGKSQTQLLCELDSPALRMTQRNVRNTKHSLQAYLRQGDAYDLFMAADHSQRITSDLADDIAEIHEQRRAVVTEAIGEIHLMTYVQYMSGKFAPVTAVKLRADSVYRHYKEIKELIVQIESQPSEKLRQLEQDARVFRRQEGAETSVVLKALQDIQINLHDAMDSKMDELATAVSAFTDRASFLALQAAVIASTGSVSSLNRVLDVVSGLEGDAQDHVLAALTARLTPVRIELVDESIVRLRGRAACPTIEAVQHVRVPTRQERLEAYVQKELDKAFTISIKDIREQVEKAIAQSSRGEILLSEIEIRTYDDFLAQSHSLEATASEDFGAIKLIAQALNIRRSNSYVEFDEFALRPANGKRGPNG